MMKYYHIMPVEVFIHNETIIKLINNNSDKFHQNEHVFVVTSEEGFQKYKDTNNMILDKSINGSGRVKSLNKYLEECDYLFLHSNDLRIFELLKLNRKYLNKIIWGVWGHDLYKIENNLNESLFKKISKGLRAAVIGPLRKKIIRQFYGLGIGFKYDSLEIRKKYGDIKIMPLLYGYNPTLKNDINRMIKEHTKNPKTEQVKVMIGHSAYPFLNHLKILKLLEKFKNENILISLPLCYGNQEYAKEVKDYAQKVFKNKVEILEDTMSFDEYFKYILSTDICILDFKHQSALGNLWLLLKSGKKIFLNKDGILKTSMMFELIETYNVCDIEKMNFMEFSKPINDKVTPAKFADVYLDEETAVKMFEQTMKELKNNYKIKGSSNNE